LEGEGRVEGEGAVEVGRVDGILENPDTRKVRGDGFLESVATNRAVEVNREGGFDGKRGTEKRGDVGDLG